MTSKRLLMPGLLFLMVGLVVISCKKDEEEDPPPPAPQVEVKFFFSNRVGTSTLNFDQIMYQNAFGNIYSVSTLQYFVSDIKLNKPDGTSVMIDTIHYVDGEDQNTLLFAPPMKVPAIDYSSISFIFGLNEEKNVTGAFTNPPESLMEWPLPMGGGYHYMKLEGKIDNDGVIENFQAHTGPTMGNPYFIEVTLPASAFTAKEGLIITIGMNINNWWTNPNTIDLNDMSSIMMDMDAQQELKANGGDVFYLESIE
jgi:hypothetical protein